MKNILVTGGCGFIGSNFVRLCLERCPAVRLVNLDKLTYAGNPANLADIEADPRYRFVKGDICDAGLVARLFAEEQIDTVVHFAAESHVDRSIDGPGRIHPDQYRRHLHPAGGRPQSLVTVQRSAPHASRPHGFLHVCTDEVYGSLGDTGFSPKPPLTIRAPPIRRARRRPTIWSAPIITPTACRP